MKLLLDTQAFLWFLLDDERLSTHAKTSIEQAETLYLSPASHWEIAIKIALGKYSLPESFTQFMARELVSNNMTILPIEISHTARLTDLPFHHRDPFDRLIIAQSLAEQLPVVSIDLQFDTYGVKRVW
ncbi:MAG: type II toxin-antitoxin system VapC family toxin [Gallionella sp.]